MSVLFNEGDEFTRPDDLLLTVESIKGKQINFTSDEGTFTYYTKDVVSALGSGKWKAHQDLGAPQEVKETPKEQTGTIARNTDHDKVQNTESFETVPATTGLPTVDKFSDVKVPKAVASDGGSSSYYTLDINGNVVETEEIIDQVFGNDFDFGNAFKSLLRAYLATQGGGKRGNSIGYDLNKVDYSVNKVRQRHA